MSLLVCFPSDWFPQCFGTYHSPFFIRIFLAPSFQQTTLTFIQGKRSSSFLVSVRWSPPVWSCVVLLSADSLWPAPWVNLVFGIAAPTQQWRLSVPEKWLSLAGGLTPVPLKWCLHFGFRCFHPVAGTTAETVTVPILGSSPVFQLEVKLGQRC